MEKVYRFFLGKIRSWSPPGYAYKEAFYAELFGIAINILYSLVFFVRYMDAYDRLFSRVPEGRERVLNAGAEMPAFGELTESIFPCFVITAFIFSAVLMILQYVYYRKDTKSIYVMKRIKDRGYLTESCVRMPLTYMLLYLITGGLLHLIYYIFYLLVTPKIFL